ncbi:hypothetical protein BDN70DRAFT_828342 [Pholiota conissans]|uniref:F-box domain-containing protein n=1 Tax=Pholiota conissans TaxID=109636 RepID=A0A9P5Z8W1_9AGAR|nr:hypothetical protein BDN70DRAFT_828342 [Pholiota conissans]
MKLTTRLRDFISDHAPMFRRRSSTIQITPFVDRIPQELLLYIFQTIVNANPRKANILIQVCSKWRNIALSSGSLWSRVILTYPIYPRQFTGVSARLARSGSYPLDILCDFRDPSWDWEEENHAFRWQEMEPVMRLLLVHVARWWRFELLTDTWSPIFTFLWYTRRVQDMPMLENLSLSRCNLYFAARGHIFQPIALRQPIPLFGGIFLSKLKSVSLVGVHIDWQPPSLRNLTELTLKFQASNVMPTLPQFDAIFQACQGLLRLTIFGWGPIFNPSTPIANGQLRLPLLQYFSFGFLDIPYSLQLLSLFDFPSLNELILEDISKAVSPGELQDATDFMLWFLSTTSPRNFRRSIYLPIHQLQSLEIHSICSDERVMASFFQESASLKRLGLFDVPTNFLALFLLQKDTVALCPQLQELYCQDMDPAIVLEVVSSRISVGGLLKKATADFLREPRPSTGSIVDQKLRKLGINILGKLGSESSDSGMSD